MFGPNVADKYASYVTKHLGLGCTSRLCSAGGRPFTYHGFVLRGCNYIIRHVFRARERLASFLPPFFVEEVFTKLYVEGGVVE